MKSYSNVPQTKSTIEALWRLEKIILDTLDFSQVSQKICDGLLTELGYLDLGYRIIVLTLINEQTGTLERIALSQTKEAQLAQSASAVPFHQIAIPLTAEENLLIKTIKHGKSHITSNWKGLFTPVLSEEQARKNQQAAGIVTSMVFPITVKEKPIGAVIFSMNKAEEMVSPDEKELLRGFCDIIGLAVQNAKLYSKLEQTSEELKQANKKLKELDHLKDEFVSIASHELRTPMTAIHSYLWMVLAGKGGAITDKQRYYLERSNSATERLMKLVNEMLNVSRIEAGRIQLDCAKIDMAKLLEDVLEEVRPRANELKLNLKFEQSEQMEAENETQVVADSDKLKEVVINLIGNSLKFTPEGGTISIQLRVERDQLVTDITDNGAGIEPENLQNLFQKFGFMKGSYRTNKDATQGTGLGLYISKSIIELHHGKIWAASAGKGQGATFSFSLPFYSDDSLKAMKLENNHHTKDVGFIPSTV